MASEYTQRISRPADELLPYLRQVRQAERGELAPLPAADAVEAGGQP